MFPDGLIAAREFHGRRRANQKKNVPINITTFSFSFVYIPKFLLIYIWRKLSYRVTNLICSRARHVFHGIPQVIRGMEGDV